MSSNQLSPFQRELEQLINKHSQENTSNTPDFILARFIEVCLVAGNQLVQQRDQWYGADLSPGMLIHEVCSPAPECDQSKVGIWNNTKPESDRELKVIANPDMEHSTTSFAGAPANTPEMFTHFDPAIHVIQEIDPSPVITTDPSRCGRCWCGEYPDAPMHTDTYFSHPFSVTAPEDLPL